VPGKGNDQVCALKLAIHSLATKFKSSLQPVREWAMVREEEINYCLLSIEITGALLI